MRVLLDECVDWRLSRDLTGHDVKTAHQMGWATIKNGDLLALATEHFDVFVTVDRNLSFQQNLASYASPLWYCVRQRIASWILGCSSPNFSPFFPEPSRALQRISAPTQT